MVNTALPSSRLAQAASFHGPVPTSATRRCAPALALALALAASLLFSGCAGRTNTNVAEKMMWSTYPLATQKGGATGFVINRRDPQAPGGVMAAVFTSVHVLDTVGNGPLIIGVRKADAAGEAKVSLIAFTPPKRRGNERFYVRHPKHDLAAFSLHLPAEITGLVDMPSSLDERKLARHGKSLHAGEEVAFLGYPEVYPGTEGAFPILRSGRVASYPVGTTQAHGRFLINADVYPGDSGAPVFIAGAGRRPELVGMITRRVGPDAQSFSHLAVAVDLKTIRETLELLAASENSESTAPPTGDGPGTLQKRLE